MMNNDNSEMCPMCGSRTKKCLLMPIREAVDLPNAELSACLERAIVFFREDLGPSMTRSQSSQVDLGQSVCIACVHLLNSCALFSIRKIQSGIFKKASSIRILQSPPQTQRTEYRRSFGMLMAEEPENTALSPMIFLDALLPSSHSPPSSAVKFKTTSTLHSDDLKRILSDFEESEPVVSNSIPGSPKQSENIEVTQDTSIVNNIELPSNKDRCEQNVNWTTQSEFDSNSLPVSQIEEKNEEPWDEKMAEDQPMLQKTPGSGEEKQELFMHSLNLCKQSSSTPSSPQSSRKMESRNDRKKNLSPKQHLQDDAPQDELLPMEVTSRSTSPVTSNQRNSAQHSPRLGPSSSSTSERIISPCQDSSARRNLASIFADNYTENNTYSNPSPPGQSLLQRVHNVTRKTATAPKINKFFVINKRKGGTEDNVHNKKTSSSIASMNSGKDLVCSSVIGARTDIVQKKAAALQHEEQKQEIDFVLKPGSFKQTKKSIPTSTKLPNFSKILSATAGTMEDFQNVQKPIEEQENQINKSSLQSSVETEISVTVPEISLKSILKKPKTFVIGAKKSVVKNVRFNSESSIRYFDNKVDSHYDCNVGENIECEANTNSQNFTATISLESNTSSVEFNITSKECNSNISFNVATKSQKESGQPSPKKQKLMVNEVQNVNKETNSNYSELRVMNGRLLLNNTKLTPVKQTNNIKSPKLSNTKGTPDLKGYKKYKHSSKLQTKESSNNTGHKCNSVPTSSNKNDKTVVSSSDVKKSLLKNSPIILKTHNIKTCSPKKMSESLEKDEKLIVDDKIGQIVTQGVSDLKYSSDCSSEEFLRNIGLIDDVVNVNSSSGKIDAVSNTDDLKCRIETNHSNLVQSKDISSSCDSELNISLEPVLSTPEVKVKKTRGRPASKKPVLSTDELQIPSTEEKETVKLGMPNAEENTVNDSKSLQGTKESENDKANNHSKSSEFEDNKAEQQTIEERKLKKKRKRFVAVKVLDKDEEVCEEDLIYVQRKIMSCYVLLRRCDDDHTTSKKIKEI